jgi:hypothetical protein|tara:strand:- start:534 stop:1196 length:663 start_codon:yes stop_codon:yes gene_type:complete
MSRVRENLIRKLVRELIKQEIDEANSTASVGGSYNTPHAFGGSNKKGKKKGKAGYKGGHTEPTDGTGHFIADDPKLRKESVKEARTINVEPNWEGMWRFFKQMAKTNPRDWKKMQRTMGSEWLKIDKMAQQKGWKSESINEGRYHAWRNDDSLSPRQKIGMSMRETRDSLKELEKMVQYNVRLKTELNVDSRSYWKNTHKALSKISERLVNLANKVGQLH